MDVNIVGRVGRSADTHRPPRARGDTLLAMTTEVWLRKRLLFTSLALCREAFRPYDT